MITDLQAVGVGGFGRLRGGLRGGMGNTVKFTDAQRKKAEAEALAEMSSDCRFTLTVEGWLGILEIDPFATRCREDWSLRTAKKLGAYADPAMPPSPATVPEKALTEPEKMKLDDLDKWWQANYEQKVEDDISRLDDVEIIPQDQGGGNKFGGIGLVPWLVLGVGVVSFMWAERRF